MRREDSLETKIVRVSLPILIYYGITLLVQMAAGIVAMVQAFMAIEEDGRTDYIRAYHFLDNTEIYLQKYNLVVLFVAAAISGIFLWRIFRKDEQARQHTTKIVNVFYGKDLLLICGAGIFASAGLAKAVGLLPIDNIIGSYEQVNLGFMSNPMVFQILSLCFAAPMIEELIYRGIIFQRLKEYTDDSAAMIGSACIFGLVHGNLVQGLYAAILGVLLCYVYEKYDTILAPVCLHMATNITALIMSYLPLSTWISQNIVLRILFMLIELALLALCMRTIYRRGKMPKG